MLGGGGGKEAGLDTREAQVASAPGRQGREPRQDSTGGGHPNSSHGEALGSSHTGASE